jgi:hypothetical protein
MDPSDINTQVDSIQAFASKFTSLPSATDRLCMPKDKWLGIDQNTKELWDQIDDKYKSIILVILNHLILHHFLVDLLANHLSF